MYLRNRLKKFFQDPENQDDSTETSIKSLLQIFAECRKPLSKVHKYEKHYHWLQVKLRKFMTLQRKRDKDEKIKDYFMQSPHKNLMESCHKGVMESSHKSVMESCHKGIMESSSYNNSKNISNHKNNRSNHKNNISNHKPV